MRAFKPTLASVDQMRGHPLHVRSQRPWTWGLSFGTAVWLKPSERHECYETFTSNQYGKNGVLKTPSRDGKREFGG